MKKLCKNRQNSGITLIALVITIVILLILAGISISALTNTGLFGKAKEAQYKTENAQAEENAILDEYASKIDEITGGSSGSTTTTVATIADVQSDAMLTKTENTTAEDAYGNKITIPAGFKVTTDATTVNQGIVIEDTNENQFVWIPVGTITKADGSTVEINLNRYTFASDGTATAQNDAVISSYYQELATSTYGNTTAKDIEAFKTSVETNGGYYIGRYEARSSSSDSITTITENGSQYVYNYVTQKQAADLARNMYSNNKFTSDLMNSYAWDTATLFLQEFGDNSTYSRKTSVNTSLATTGTNNSDTKDVQCNVYDMASNTWEWTTETSSYSNYPWVARGGYCYGVSNCPSRRDSPSITGSIGDFGFRPLLYL